MMIKASCNVTQKDNLVTGPIIERYELRIDY